MAKPNDHGRNCARNGNQRYRPCNSNGRPCRSAVGNNTSLRPQSRTLSFYQRNAIEFANATADLSLDELYVPFLQQLRPGALILDAGCGSGRDTKAFLERGYRVFAIDFSAPLAEIASRNSGQRCEVMSLQELAFQQEFDGVWACAVLLHLPRAEIGIVLRRLIAALKPYGICFVSLKEGRGEGYASDGRFFSFYSSQEITQLIASIKELTILKSWTTTGFDSSGKVCNWLNVVAKKTREKCLPNEMVDVGGTSLSN